MPELKDLKPTPPEKGPPLPSAFDMSWPRGIQDILKPGIELRLHIQREGIRQINKAIEVYEGTRGKLPKVLQERLNELYRLRNAMVRREAQMRRFRR